MANIEQQLVDLFRQLGAADQATLLSFAEFLGSKSSAAAPVRKTPVEIPPPEKVERPANETVVGVLKRLAKTYPMLDKSEMLRATSELVTAHIMQGREAANVIDELEEIFSSHYEKMKLRNKGATG